MRSPLLSSHLYLKVTIFCLVIENFIYIKPLLRAQLSYIRPLFLCTKDDLLIQVWLFIFQDNVQLAHVTEREFASKFRTSNLIQFFRKGIKDTKKKPRKDHFGKWLISIDYYNIANLYCITLSLGTMKRVVFIKIMKSGRIWDLKNVIKLTYTGGFLSRLMELFISIINPNKDLPSR